MARLKVKTSKLLAQSKYIRNKIGKQHIETRRAIAGKLKALRRERGAKKAKSIYLEQR